MELNKVYWGDCLEEMKKIPDKSIDLVFTSPPYNMRTRVRYGKYTSREKSEHFSKKYSVGKDDLSPEDYYKFHYDCIEEMKRIGKLIIWNVQVVTGNKEAVFRIIGDNAKYIKDIVIWDKGHGEPAMHERLLNSQYEILLIISPIESPGREIKLANFERGKLSNLWKIARKSKYKDFPASMPSELAEVVINNFSKKNDLILDPFAGSGTTAIACLNTNRNYILIEKENQT